MSAASTLPAPASSMAPPAPDPISGARAARECAMQAGDLKLANAYYMLADALGDVVRLEHESARRHATSRRLAAQVGGLEVRAERAERERDRAQVEVARLRALVLDEITALEGVDALDHDLLEGVIARLSNGRVGGGQ